MGTSNLGTQIKKQYLKKYVQLAIAIVLTLLDQKHFKEIIEMMKYTNSAALFQLSSYQELCWNCKIVYNTILKYVFYVRKYYFAECFIETNTIQHAAIMFAKA